MTLSYQRFDEDINQSSGLKRTSDAIYGLAYSYDIPEHIKMSLNDYYEDIAYNENDFTYNTFDAQLAYETQYKGLGFLAAYTFSHASIGGDISNTFYNHSGLLRMGYDDFYASAVQGHRFPSIVNLAKSIITEKGIDIANSDLESETSTTYTLGYDNGHFFTKAYYRVLKNLITRKLLPEQIDGKDAYKTINAKNGEMYGGIVGVNYDYEAIYTSLYGEYTYGKNDTDYISKITPFHATAMLQYHDAFIQYLYGLKAKNMSQSDQKDIRIIGHNNGYSIFNLGYRLQHRNHQLSLMLHNVFNSQGRVYASSVDFPKRSLDMTYAYHF